MALSQEYTVEKYSLPTCMNDVMEPPGASVRDVLERTNRNTPTERPQSALARGVQIHSFNESRVNPEPIMLEDTDILLEEYLSPRKLRALTGVDDLDQVKYLEMKVDTSETSLGNFGALLTNLIQLKVSNSIIATVRDLGSSLDNLRVLWMARCSLHEVDGLSSMYNLRELYLAYNEISDLSPMSMLEHLQILDLEGNNIDEISQIEFLAMISTLTNLTLEGNPICVTPSPDKADPNYDYRQSVRESLRSLQVLDDEPFIDNLSQKNNATSVFDADWALINELMAEGNLVDSQESIDVANSPVNSRPGTGTGSRPFTSSRAPGGYRPGTALKPTVSMKRPQTTANRPPQTGNVRPMTGRPGSGQRPGTARPGSAGSDQAVEEASELTLGNVVCGNPSKALRERRKRQDPSTNTAKMFAPFKHKPEHSYDPENIDDENLKEIFNELKEWKKQNEVFKAQRELDRAPQVLVINDEPLSSASSVCDDDSDDDDEDVNVSNEQSRRLGLADEDIDGNLVQQKIIEATKKAGAVRARRYRKLDFDNVGDNSEKHSHSEDGLEKIENFTSYEDDESRPISGPAAVKREKFRLETESRSEILRQMPKEITKPVIKMSNQIKERIPPPNVPRATTARATMALPTPPRLLKNYPALSSIQSRQPQPPPK